MVLSDKGCLQKRLIVTFMKIFCCYGCLKVCTINAQPSLSVFMQDRLLQILTDGQIDKRTNRRN